MALSQSYLDYIVERLSTAGGAVSARRMFGGAGVYRGGVLFALLDDDVLYFKVDDSNRGDYEKAGMEPFRPDAARPDYTMPYYEVPGDVLESDVRLKRWMETAIAVARQKKAAGTAAARKPAARKPKK